MSIMASVTCDGDGDGCWCSMMMAMMSGVAVAVTVADMASTNANARGVLATIWFRLHGGDSCNYIHNHNNIKFMCGHTPIGTHQHCQINCNRNHVYGGALGSGLVGPSVVFLCAPWLCSGGLLGWGLVGLLVVFLWGTWAVFQWCHGRGACGWR